MTIIHHIHLESRNEYLSVLMVLLHLHISPSETQLPQLQPKRRLAQFLHHHPHKQQRNALLDNHFQKWAEDEFLVL